MGGGPDGPGGIPIGECRRLTGGACTKKDWSEWLACEPEAIL
jgi:hypothetical protein